MDDTRKVLEKLYFGDMNQKHYSSYESGHLNESLSDEFGLDNETLIQMKQVIQKQLEILSPENIALIFGNLERSLMPIIAKSGLPEAQYQKLYAAVRYHVKEEKRALQHIISQYTRKAFQIFFK